MCMPLLFRNIFTSLNCQEAAVMQLLVKEGTHRYTGKKLKNQKYIARIYQGVGGGEGGDCSKFCVYKYAHVSKSLNSFRCTTDADVPLLMYLLHHT